MKTGCVVTLQFIDRESQVTTSCECKKAVGQRGPAEIRALEVVYWGKRAIWDTTNETPVVSAPAEGISKEH